MLYLCGISYVVFGVRYVLVAKVVVRVVSVWHWLCCFWCGLCPSGKSCACCICMALVVLFLVYVMSLWQKLFVLHVVSVWH